MNQNTEKPKTIITQPVPPDEATQSFIGTAAEVLQDLLMSAYESGIVVEVRLESDTQNPAMGNYQMVGIVRGARE